MNKIDEMLKMDRIIPPTSRRHGAREKNLFWIK